MPAAQDPADFYALVDIIKRLNGADGCPWDRQQTHTSLRECLLEECYEVLEALDVGDTDKLAVELGDLLLQIIMHSQIASKAGEFGLGDVISSISTKLVRRHPHVFDSLDVGDAEEVMLNWEKHKKKERGEEASMLDGVPRQMPSLAYSQEVQSRVARVGFDWGSDEGVVDKLAEEVAEYKEARDKEQRAAEFGDVLFTLANVARRQGIDLEAALRQSNSRFYERFARMEEFCRQRCIDFTGLPFNEKNKLWEEAKKGIAEG